MDTSLIHSNLWLFIWYGFSINLATDWYLFELHFILSEGPSFVREYKFYLAQLFNKVGVSADSAIFFFIFEIHGLVKGDQTTLAKFEHLNDDV